MHACMQAGMQAGRQEAEQCVSAQIKRRFCHPPSAQLPFLRRPAALIRVAPQSGLPLETITAGCLALADDCRAKGTRFRLRSVLEAFLRDLLPTDAHERCNGAAYVAVTRALPPGPVGPELVSQYRSRDDLIATLLTSCHVPWWFDGTLARPYRDGVYLDGGLTNFIPTPPVRHTVKVRLMEVGLAGWRPLMSLLAVPCPPFSTCVLCEMNMLHRTEVYLIDGKKCTRATIHCGSTTEQCCCALPLPAAARSPGPLMRFCQQPRCLTPLLPPRLFAGLLLPIAAAADHQRY